MTNNFYRYDTATIPIKILNFDGHFLFFQIIRPKQVVFRNKLLFLKNSSTFCNARNIMCFFYLISLCYSLISLWKSVQIIYMHIMDGFFLMCCAKEEVVMQNKIHLILFALKLYPWKDYINVNLAVLQFRINLLFRKVLRFTQFVPSLLLSLNITYSIYNLHIYLSSIYLSFLHKRILYKRVASHTTSPLLRQKAAN